MAFVSLRRCSSDARSSGGAFGGATLGEAFSFFVGAEGAFATFEGGAFAAFAGAAFATSEGAAFPTFEGVLSFFGGGAVGVLEAVAFAGAFAAGAADLLAVGLAEALGDGVGEPVPEPATAGSAFVATPEDGALATGGGGTVGATVSVPAWGGLL
jgi:hypothetical protein